MAWLTAQDEFNPDQLPNSVLGIAAALAQHDSGVHRHKMGQLLFSQQGCISITLNQSICILPPARLAWIPPLVEHRAEVTSFVDYRSIYLDTHRYPVLPLQLEVLATTPLLQEVLERIACADFDTDWEQGAPSNILAVFLDEISIARCELRLLPLPSDRRLKHLVRMPRLLPLHVLAQNIGASEKTISRIFRKETGLSYQQWRQQWRLIKAIELLAEEYSLSTVASQLDFSSDSAFLTFFKNRVGCSPRVYMRGTVTNRCRQVC